MHTHIHHISLTIIAHM